MKAARITFPKKYGRLSTPKETDALARKIKAQTKAFSKKVLKGL